MNTRLNTLHEAWDAINSQIKAGPLQGNGWDESAQRNGLVIATNIVSELMKVGKGVTMKTADGYDAVELLLFSLKWCRDELDRAYDGVKAIPDDHPARNAVEDADATIAKVRAALRAEKN